MSLSTVNDRLTKETGEIAMCLFQQSRVQGTEF